MSIHFRQMRNFAIKKWFLMKNTYNHSVLYNNINQIWPFPYISRPYIAIYKVRYQEDHTELHGRWDDNSRGRRHRRLEEEPGLRWLLQFLLLFRQEAGTLAVHQSPILLQGAALASESLATYNISFIRDARKSRSRLLFKFWIQCP